MSLIPGSVNQILCAINKLWQAVFVNGFQCVSNAAQIIIGTDALTLTADSISCDTDLTITAPLTKFPKSISTVDQYWSGLIYAKDKINVLINPGTRECAFGNINCNDISNANTNLVVTATNGVLSKIQNCTSNINNIKCTTSTKTVNCNTDRSYTVNTQNSFHSVTCTGTAIKTVISPAYTQNVTATTAYTMKRTVPSTFSDTLVIAGQTYKLVPIMLNGGTVSAYVYVLQSPSG